MGRKTLFNENSSFTQTKAFSSTARNSSYVIPGVYDLSVEDSNWVLTSSFIIFTMQTGECCCVIATRGMLLKRDRTVQVSECWNLAVCPSRTRRTS